MKKPTRVLSNMPSIAMALDRRCSNDHRHVHLMSGRAKAAARYSDEFCHAIVDGIQTHLEFLVMASNGDSFVVDCGDLHDFEGEEFGDSEVIPFAFREGGWCLDDVHGGALPLDLVREGRQAEMEGFSSRRVYTVRPRWEATAKGLKVVGVRWVDCMKGSKVRSRLVCQDFNNDVKDGIGRSDDMFAPTPPLMASRWLVSCMSTQGASGLGELL